MKKLLLLLLCVPFIVLGQDQEKIKQANDILRLSDIQVEKILLEDINKINETLHYGFYMLDGSESQKMGYAKISGSIDTVSSNEMYLSYNMYMYFDMSVDGNIDSTITIFSGSFNALPPYEFIQEETRVIQYGNEDKLVSKLVGGKYITTTFRNSKILQVDTTNCTISNYGLRDRFVGTYIVSELDAGKSNVFPYRSYSISEGLESIDSVCFVKSQHHLVDGNNLRSYTFGTYSDDMYLESIYDEYGNEILLKLDQYLEMRLENESQAKDMAYTADLLSFGNLEMIPTKPETDYDTTQGKLSVIYEIHGEYKDVFIEDNHQEVFEENGKKYIKSHNFNMNNSFNQSEVDSLLSYSNVRYPINDLEIIDFANSAINLEQEDSIKINELLGFVYNYIEYSFVQKWHTNVYSIIESKKGVCSDKAYLFNVLARIIGIPCKEVMGLAYGAGEWGLHAWNEVLINNKWYSIDPTWDMWQVPVNVKNNFIITIPHLKMKDDYFEVPQFSLSLSSMILEDGSKVDFIIDDNPTSYGCILGDCENGQGTFSWFDGSKYVGQWEEGNMHGQGTLTYEDTKYIGEFKEGLYHGEGTLTYEDGSKYVGQWEEGNMHGQGTLTYEDTKYIGEFKEGLYHGEGTLTYEDGRKYIGEFKEGLCHGQGTANFEDGRKYIGEFEKGLYHGEGTFTYEDAKYIGGFKEGLCHGQGTANYEDGRKYIGEWKEGKKEGIGKLTYSDGKVEEGKFMLNVYIGKE
jgi:hypothetical protein